MAMSKELLDDVLTSVHDDRLRRRLADALTRENTELCEVVSMLSQLSAHLKEVDSKNYVTPERHAASRASKTSSRRWAG
jgi:hypothetical protein